jgi:hypothetical protein
VHIEIFDRNRKRGQIVHGLLVIFGFLRGVVGWLGRKIRQNTLRSDSINVLGFGAIEIAYRA